MIEVWDQSPLFVHTSTGRKIISKDTVATYSTAIFGLTISVGSRDHGLQFPLDVSTKFVLPILIRATNEPFIACL